MNVLLISQCSKNALTETRRILDQFAERRGERTWQTAITQDGLETLHRLLRKTARKNTAVACHWVRGKDHSELIWVVGDLRQFNGSGATPTNLTRRDVLRIGDENDWHSAEDIRLLAKIAALFHDLGKANDAFQIKLSSQRPITDVFRHEWVSLRLFEAFVRQCGNQDDAWLSQLIALPELVGEFPLANLKADGLQRQSNPFKDLPPVAQAVGWLIVSHHRIPVPSGSELSEGLLKRLPELIEHDWCGSRVDGNEKEIEACWLFKKGLSLNSRHWRRHAADVAAAILKRPSLVQEAAALVASPYVMHLSRLVLMLADHYYSAQPSSGLYGDPLIGKKAVPYANTGFGPNGQRKLKQRLDEHLIGVEVSAGRIMRTLPQLAQYLPRIGRHKGFRERSKGSFRWQNAAFDLAESLSVRSSQQGFFGVNLASTGCGKTLANGRIIYGLADPRLGARFTVALGLRVLTRQTGDAYRERLGLGAEDLAVLVGGAANRALHEQLRNSQDEWMAAGSESAAALLPEHNYVHYEGSLEDGPLKKWLGKNSDALRLLDAPVLACTIDHLMPAVEGTRGGHQIAPMLRLMTSDLILDEPDDFGMEDLPALTRLVHWAGLLGSRVLLSSATLPPALVQGLFLAYLAGRQEYQRHRGVPGNRDSVCCAWFDEFSVTSAELGDGKSYLAENTAFVERRLSKLAIAEVRRRALIQPLPIGVGQSRDVVCGELAKYLQQYLHDLHRHHHSLDPKTGRRVSFGLIRMANIDPLFDVARAMFGLGAEPECRIHLCVYHSRHPMLVRAGIERVLDAVLKRHQPEAVFALPGLRRALDNSLEPDQIFVVLATAVAEVGRDHDYDWSIVEPSSMRSIIQLAGRVRRHRSGICPADSPNLFLLDTNVRHLVLGDGKPAFLRPGFEDASFPLDGHYLTELLTDEQWQPINAVARIQERDKLSPRVNLVDLEHARLRDLMLGANPGQEQKAQPVHRWWTTRAHLSAELQKRRPFRADPQGRLRYALIPDENDHVQFVRLEDDGGETKVGNLWNEIELPPSPSITSWGTPEYLESLMELAEAQQIDLCACARIFGSLDLPGKAGDQIWRYHPMLGFSRYR
jgi:CRISPR-associated endonuclease/helicase Cas3